MRTHTAAEANAARATHVNHHQKVEVARADGVFIDLSGWVKTLEWGRDQDQAVMEGTVTFKREQDPTLSLAPLMGASTINRAADGVTYSPLLRSGREIRISFCAVAPGAAPVWRLALLGVIDDVDPSADEDVRVTFRDIGARILDKQFVNEQNFGSETGDALEAVIQDILDFNDLSTVTLYTPASPAWMLLDFSLAEGSIGDEIRKLANQIGWDVRYEFDAADLFRYTLFNPFRDPAVVDYAFGPDDYVDVPRFNETNADVRNRVRVDFELLDGTPDFVDIWDNASIAEHGERFMRIGVEETFNIHTEAAALELAQSVLRDVVNRKTGAEKRLWLWPYVQVGDKYSFASNDVHYDSTQTFHVTGFRHEFAEDGTAYTRLRLEGVPTGMYSTWTRRARPIGGTGIDYMPKPPTADIDIRMRADRTYADVTFSGAFGDNGIGPLEYSMRAWFVAEGVIPPAFGGWTQVAPAPTIAALGMVYPLRYELRVRDTGADLMTTVSRDVPARLRAIKPVLGGTIDRAVPLDDSKYVFAKPLAGDPDSIDAVGQGVTYRKPLAAYVDGSGNVTTTQRIETEVGAGTLESTAGAQAKADAAAAAAQQAAIDEAIRNGSRLINNPTLSGTLDRWALAVGQSIVQRAFGLAADADVMEMHSDGNRITYTDMFEVDPGKAYEISAWTDHDGLGLVGTRHYFGILVYDENDAAIAVMGPSGVSSTNPYFWYALRTDAINNPSGVWTRHTGFVLPAGTGVDRLAGLGENVIAPGSGLGGAFVLPPNARKMRVRFLNYYNDAANPSKLWIANVDVQEVPMQVVEARRRGDTLYGSDGTLTGTAKESGGKFVNLLLAKTLAADPDHFDGVPEGTTYRKTTLNEKTGAGRGYSALDASNRLTTEVLGTALVDGETAARVRGQALAPTQNLMGPNVRFSAIAGTYAFTSGVAPYTSLASRGLKAGDTISWSGLLWSSGATGLRIRITFYNAANGGVGTYETDLYDDSTSTPFRVRREGLVIPANAVSFYVYMTYSGRTGSISGDEVMLNRGPVALPFQEPPLRPNVESAGDLNRAAGSAIKVNAVITHLADTGHLAATAQESGGKLVNKLFAKALAGDPDTLDYVPQGTTFRKARAADVDAAGVVLNAGFSERQKVWDARGFNEPPSAYSMGITREFKYRVEIGAPGVATYGELETTKPWTDSTGGHATQIFRSSDGEFVRTGAAGGAAWGAWHHIIEAQTNRISRTTGQPDATVTESGGKAINRLFAKALAADADNLGSVPDQAGVYVRTTPNEKTGAGRGYNALDASNLLTTGTGPDARIGGLLATAISDEGQLRDPRFQNWPVGNTYPYGWVVYVNTTNSKETSATYIGEAAHVLRFDVANATWNTGLIADGGVAFKYVPQAEYFTAECEALLVSGAWDGSGVLVDIVGSSSGYYRQYLSFKQIFGNPPVGGWQNFRLTFKVADGVPSGTFGTSISHVRIYLMANFLSADFETTGAVKVLLVKRVDVRPATQEEIKTCQALSGGNALSSGVVQDGKALAKGHAKVSQNSTGGALKDGDAFVYPAGRFTTPPQHVQVLGGLTIQPDSTKWSTPASYSATAPQYREVYINGHTKDGGTLVARLKQVLGVLTARTETGWSNANNIKLAGTAYAVSATIDFAPAYDNVYTVKVTVRYTLRPNSAKGPTSGGITIGVRENSTGAWVERATASSFNDNYDYAEQTFTETLYIPFTQSGLDGLDSIDVYIKSFDGGTADMYLPGSGALLEPYADPIQIEYTTSSAQSIYASMTPTGSGQSLVLDALETSLGS